MRSFLWLPIMLLGSSAPLAAQQLVLLQNSDGYSIVESAQWQSPTPQDAEAADDFTFTGDVTRVIVHGYKDFHVMGALDVEGVWVRFYASSNQAPGALQYELFLPEGSIAFGHDPYPTKLDVRLPIPFEASGQHFVSVQLVTAESHLWRWWSSHTQSPHGAPAYVKDDLAGATWEVYQTVLGFQSDLAYELWGDDGSPIDDPVDACGVWEELHVPPLPESYGTTILRDLVVIANDDAWAVGDPSVEVQFLNFEFKNYALHWDGSLWTEVPTPNPGVFPDPFQQTGLQAIDASGPQDVWAVGNWERQDAFGFIITQPLVLRWNGSDWEHLIVPNTNNDTYTYDVKVFAPDDVWLIGGGGQPLAVHWDGEEFAVDMPDLGVGGGTPGFEFEAVDGVSSDDLWAVGGGSDGDFSGTTFIAHWDGSGWESVPGPAPGFARRLFDVHAIASDDVWAVGQYEELVGSSVQFFAWAIHWDGSSWELHDGADQPIGSLAVHAFGPDEVYTAGGRIHRFDGAAWRVADDLDQLTGDNIFVSIAALDAVEPCQLYAAGRQDDFGSLVPFTARQQGPSVWATSFSSCDTAPGLPDGLSLVSGPKLGKSFTVAIGDANGLSGFTPGATATAWMISLASLPNLCGIAIPGTGLGGASAALFIDPTRIVATTGPVVWNGLGEPALHTVSIPAAVSLHGIQLHTQGILLDASQPSPLLLTDALFAVMGL